MQSPGDTSDRLGLAFEIERLIEKYLASPEGSLSHDVVRRAHALPVYDSMGGTLFVTPNGDVLVLPIDEEGIPVPEVELRWRSLALVSACRKYPQLERLRPARPGDALDCPDCAATGRQTVGRVELWCGSCYGLGWRRLGG